jgi:GGDEF domain-containing protein
VKIRKAVESLVVPVDGREHRVTISVGAALLPRTGAPYTSKMLLEVADQQLYASKDKGRNCCSMKQLQPATAAPIPA